MEDFEKFSSENTVIADTDHALEVSANEEKFYPNEIIKSFDQKITKLHAELLRIESYIDAKKNKPSVEEQIDNLTMSRPVSALSISEKLSEVQKYDLLIKSFEENGVPSEIYKEAKEDLEYLKSKVLLLSQIKNVAENNPSLN